MWQMDYKRRHFSAMNRRSVRICRFFFSRLLLLKLYNLDRETEWFFITSVSTSSEKKSLHLMQSLFHMAHHWCEYSKFQGHFAFKRAMLTEWQLNFELLIKRTAASKQAKFRGLFNSSHHKILSLLFSLPLSHFFSFCFCSNCHQKYIYKNEIQGYNKAKPFCQMNLG